MATTMVLLLLFFFLAVLGFELLLGRHSTIEPLLQPGNHNDDSHKHLLNADDGPGTVLSLCILSVNPCDDV
jgi:hypothetical protein